MTLESVEALCKLLHGKQLLIFDFDGTLADTSPLHEAAFNAVLAPWGIKCDYPAIAGRRTRDALAACFATTTTSVTESELHELTLSKQTKVRKLIEESLQPLPGVDQFLRWARPRYQLALYSSGSRGTVSLAMEKLGYSDWFEPMLCAEDVENAKPHPEGFLKILTLTGLTARDVLIFEDSNSGVTAAVAAKCRVLKMVGQPASDAHTPSMEMVWNDLLSILEITSTGKQCT